MPANPDGDLVAWHPQTIPQPPEVLANGRDSGGDVSTINGALSFTNASYGGMIPIVFGSDRLTGTVIWATPVYQKSITLGDGTVQTWNAISYALLLCEGPINGILRVWLGDRLVLDNSIEVDGDNVAVANEDGTVPGFTIDLTDPEGPFAQLDASARKTTVRVFNGTETQVPEGAMVDIQGYESTPAYRGYAYIILDNFIIDSTSIPAVSFEVSSNTNTLAPRRFGDFIDTVFDTWRQELLTYDGTVDRFYAIAQDLPARGLQVVDGNTMEELAQFEIEDTYDIGPTWDTALVMPLTGHLVVFEPSGNAGMARVINPFSGGLMSTLGPGGNLVSHSLTDGFAVTKAQNVTCFDYEETRGAGLGTNGIKEGVGVVGELNRSIGFAKLENGELEMKSSLDLTTPYINNAVCSFRVTQAYYNAATPAGRKWYDDEPIYGTWMFGFSYQNNETVSIKPWRVGVASPTFDIAEPRYQELAEISLDKFAGSGLVHTVQRCMTDLGDYCPVLYIEVASGTSAYLAKYNPFTGFLKWSTQLPAPMPAGVQGGKGPSWGVLTGGIYGWVDVNNAVWKIDLETGVINSVFASLSGQSLPNMLGGRQFFNGYEKSLTYLSGTADQHIVKVFIERVTRSTVELSEIVVNLVERTGLLEADLTVSDLAGLTVFGYTITSVRSIRDCLTELKQVFQFDVSESNGHILYRTRGESADFTIPHDYLMGGDDSDWLIGRQKNDGAAVRKINLSYRDLDRDYNQNVQSVILTKYSPQVFDPEAMIDVDVPIVMTAAQAKALAEILLYSKLIYNTTYEFTLAPRYLRVDPSDVLSITMPDGEDDLTLRARTVDVDEANTIRITATEENADIYNDQLEVFGNLGTYHKARIPNANKARVDILVLDIHARMLADIPKINRAELFLAFLAYDDNTVLSNPMVVGFNSKLYAVEQPSNFVTWGYVTRAPIQTKSTGAFDYESVLEITLMSEAGAQLISGTEEDALITDTFNLAYINGELLQFVNVTSLGGDKYRLTTLVRGKFGSEAAAHEGLSAVSGSKFILIGGPGGVIDQDGTRSLEDAIVTPSETLVSIDLKNGNPFQPPYQVRQLIGKNNQPFRVGGWEAHYSGNDAVLNWQYRARHVDGAYPDDGDTEHVELSEGLERYTLYLHKDPDTFDASDPTTYLRKVRAETNTYTYVAADQTTDGFDRTTERLCVAIAQEGWLVSGPFEVATVVGEFQTCFLDHV